MTDNEIIKALSCCADAPYCPTDCPLIENDRDCLLALQKPMLDLINRQKAEIKKLKNDYRKLIDEHLELCDTIIHQKAEIETLEKRLDTVQGAKCVYSYDGETVEYCVHSPCPISTTADQLRAEAIKDFAEKCKTAAGRRLTYIADILILQNDIDSLVKEMVGDSE